MNAFVDELMNGKINDPELFIKAMDNSTTRTETLAKFKAELANLPIEKIPRDRMPPLPRNIRRQLKKALPQLKVAAEKARTVSGAERERLAAELREKEPDAPSFDELTALMPFMLEMLTLVERIPEPKTKAVFEKGPDAFATLQGLGRLPDNAFVADHFKAQLQAGKNWAKKGAWKKNTQGDMALPRNMEIKSHTVPDFFSRNTSKSPSKTTEGTTYPRTGFPLLSTAKDREELN
jgi:hypothetical protein